MAQPVHESVDLTVYKMVKNRLPFLEDTTNNEELVSNFTLEVMHELGACFGVEPEDIGDEAKYTVLQKSIIADIVSVYILIIQMVANAGGVSSSSETVTPGDKKVLTSATAGSVSVEWSQFNSKSGASLNMSGGDLLMKYKKSAIRKARTLGCLIDICDDCSIAVEIMMGYSAAPFIVVAGGGCGCKDIPERG